MHHHPFAPDPPASQQGAPVPSTMSAAPAFVFPAPPAVPRLGPLPPVGGPPPRSASIWSTGLLLARSEGAQIQKDEQQNKTNGLPHGQTERRPNAEKKHNAAQTKPPPPPASGLPNRFTVRRAAPQAQRRTTYDLNDPSIFWLNQKPLRYHKAVGSGGFGEVCQVGFGLFVCGGGRKIFRRKVRGTGVLAKSVTTSLSPTVVLAKSGVDQVCLSSQGR